MKSAKSFLQIIDKEAAIESLLIKSSEGLSVAVQVKRLPHSVGLSLPNYMTMQSAGMDLAAAIHQNIHLYPQEISLVPTGLVVALPRGYEFQIRPRSGLAVKHGLTVINAPGTIDADYRGEIKVGLINLGSELFTIKRGQRIAQMILTRIWHTSWQEVDSLPITERGEGGFGHSGAY